MHANQHAGTTFLVPMRVQTPDVGFLPPSFTETIQDEVAEIASVHAAFFPAANENPHELIRFGMAVVAMLERRALSDIEDFPKPVAMDTRPIITPEHERRIAAASLGRLLDWICKGRGVLDMGPRVFVVASHIRASAVDHRTDQEAAHEIGNDSRASINKIKGEFRRALGADYPGETGKSSNTKTRCKNSRIQQLQN